MAAWLASHLRFYPGEGRLRQVCLTLSGIMIYLAAVAVSGIAALANLPKIFFLVSFVTGIMVGVVPLALAFRAADKKGADLPTELVAESLSDPVPGLFLLWPVAILSAFVGAYCTYTSFAGEDKAAIIWTFVMAVFLGVGGLPGAFWIWRRKFVRPQGASLETGTELGRYRRVDTIPLETIEGLILMKQHRGLLTRFVVSVNVRGESAPRRLVDSPYQEEGEQALMRIAALMNSTGKRITVTRKI